MSKETVRLVPKVEWLTDDREVHCTVCGVLICLSLSELRERKQLHFNFHQDLAKIFMAIGGR
jgi:hypothetical protein